MAMFFNRLSKEEIKEKYTHYAVMFGFVPIYIGKHEKYGSADVRVRNNWPEWLFSVGFLLSNIVTYLKWVFSGDCGEGWKILITGEIEK